MSRFGDILNLHERGFISICTDKGGSTEKFLTCGIDGTINVWTENCLTQKETVSMKSIADATNACITWLNDDVYLGCTLTDMFTGVDQKVAGKTTIDDLESFSKLLTFSLDVTTVDATESHLVAGTSDFAIKKLSLSSSDNEYDRIETNGEVLHVAISPNNKYFSAACCDGSITIYSMGNNEIAKQIERVFATINGTDVSNPRITFVWSKDSSRLFLPCTGLVKVITVNDWLVKEIKYPTIETDVFSVLCLSKCGNFLAASTMSNKVCIWDISALEIVPISLNEYKRHAREASTISSIAFSPFNPRDLLIADINGGLCVLYNALAKPSSPNVAAVDTDVSLTSDPGSNDDESDDDFANIRRKSRANFIMEEADEDDNTRMSGDVGLLKRKYGFDDPGTESLENYGFTVGNEPTDFGEDVNRMPSIASRPQVVTNVVEYEPPTVPRHFASGSTPDHLSSRYLKWNSHGMVRYYNTDESNTIEIEFHNTTIHPEIVMDNSEHNFTLADLSQSAIILASVAETKTDQSEILVIHVAAWDTMSKRWNTKLPAKDGAVDVVISNELAFVITERRNIRVFTLAGTQRLVVSHPGPIITAACFNSQLAIVSPDGGEYYEDGKKKPKPQYKHSVTTYDFGKKWFHSSTASTSTALPVHKNSKLCWLSFSSQGHLVFMDSSNEIYMRSPNGLWIPIFSGESEIKEEADAIWPIAVLEDKRMQIRYLVCRAIRYPSVEQKLTPITSEWKLPFLSKDTDKTKIEEELFINELKQCSVKLDGTDGETDLVELASKHLQSLVKLFALACKSERESRAVEFAHMVTSAKGIQTMIAYATKQKRTLLAEKIAKIGRSNIVSEPYDSFAHSANRQQQQPVADDSFVPPSRRLSVKRKVETTGAAMPPRTVIREDEVELDYNAANDSITEEHNAMDNSFVSVSSQQTELDVSRYNRNPFKRTCDPSASIDMDTSSISVYEQLEQSFDNSRKRIREEEPAPVKSKQAKLVFTPKGKENQSASNKVTYHEWLENNETKLRGEFNGDDEDFSRFCVQKFRMECATKRKTESKSKGEVSV